MIDHPALQILWMLAAVIGLPYFLLSTTAPLIQSWLSARHANPYRLYALSNAGALLALISYPLYIEPRFTVHAQIRGWSLGFAIFAALCGASAFLFRKENPALREHAPTSWKERLEWIALSAAGSMLLLATTNQITENVAPVPLLWVLPLAIYLITFILAFESSRWYARPVFLRLLAVALCAVGYAISDISLSDAIAISLPIFCGALFIGCMFCHGELNLLKPPAAQLTTFYLMIAAGGAIGAIFVGLVAPLIFSGVYELPVTLIVVATLALWRMWPYGWSPRLLWAAVTAAMMVVTFAQVRAYHRNAVALTRDFYGSLRVVDQEGVRKVFHGTVEHGAQFLDARRKIPTTYYSYSSGVGQALDSIDRPKRVGVIGLGAGTLAAYGKPGDEFHFYEINPRMVDIANQQFSFLSDSAAHIDVTLGDARLSLEAEPPQDFDVLVVDAFSGDAIPVHLLTQEAFVVYLRHLKPAGILAIHISNQYLDLAPVVGALAESNGLIAHQTINGKDESRKILAATWITMTRGGSPVRTTRVWTDDYNDLLQVMRWIPQGLGSK